MDNREPMRICNLCFYHEDKSSRNFSRHATKIHGGITDYRIEYLDEDELQELRAKWALFKINRYRNVSPINSSSTTTPSSSSSSSSASFSISPSTSASILSQHSRQSQHQQHNHQDHIHHQLLLQQQQLILQPSSIHHVDPKSYRYQQQTIDNLSPHQLHRALKKQNSKYNVVNLLLNSRETNEAFFSQLINS
ncbi:uncharacterized protein LOC128394784 [Panonychus citri]|uniref:uncharacterized protein LOC128394784 n=1 Tax=Panonychus citri TaxID=50023 RepID=UPI00230774C0|nr:uncharacterized protein LOC128394784 [Panonychus citri]